MDFMKGAVTIAFIIIALCIWETGAVSNNGMHDYSRNEDRTKRPFYGDQQHPAKSCSQIFKQMPNLPSGVYWLDVFDWTRNKTLQLRHYCQNTLSNETKTGLGLKGQQGQIGVEDLSIGEPDQEPFDWEELTEENWPLPVTPPTEEEMQRRLQKAVKDYKKKMKNKGTGNTGSNMIVTGDATKYKQAQGPRKISNDASNARLIGNPSIDGTLGLNNRTGANGNFTANATISHSRNQSDEKTATNIVYNSEWPANRNYTYRTANMLDFNETVDPNLSSVDAANVNASTAVRNTESRNDSSYPYCQGYIPSYNGTGFANETSYGANKSALVGNFALNGTFDSSNYANNRTDNSIDLDNRSETKGYESEKNNYYQNNSLSTMYDSTGISNDNNNNSFAYPNNGANLEQEMIAKNARYGSDTQYNATHWDKQYNALPLLYPASQHNASFPEPTASSNDYNSKSNVNEGKTSSNATVNQPNGALLYGSPGISFGKSVAAEEESNSTIPVISNNYKEIVRPSDGSSGVSWEGINYTSPNGSAFQNKNPNESNSSEIQLLTKSLAVEAALAGKTSYSEPNYQSPQNTSFLPINTQLASRANPLLTSPVSNQSLPVSSYAQTSSSYENQGHGNYDRNRINDNGTVILSKSSDNILNTTFINKANDANVANEAYQYGTTEFPQLSKNGSGDGFSNIPVDISGANKPYRYGTTESPKMPQYGSDAGISSTLVGLSGANETHQYGTTVWPQLFQNGSDASSNGSATNTTYQYGTTVWPQLFQNGSDASSNGSATNTTYQYGITVWPQLFQNGSDASSNGSATNTTYQYGITVWPQLFQNGSDASSSGSATNTTYQYGTTVLPQLFQNGSDAVSIGNGTNTTYQYGTTELPQVFQNVSYTFYENKSLNTPIGNETNDHENALRPQVSQNYSNMGFGDTSPGSYQQLSVPNYTQEHPGYDTKDYENYIGNKTYDNSTSVVSQSSYNQFNITNDTLAYNLSSYDIYSRLPIDDGSKNNTSNGNEAITLQPPSMTFIHTKEQKDGTKNGSKYFVDLKNASNGGTRFIEKTSDLNEKIILYYDNTGQNMATNGSLMKTLAGSLESSLKRENIGASTAFGNGTVDRTDMDKEQRNNASLKDNGLIGSSDSAMNLTGSNNNTFFSQDNRLARAEVRNRSESIHLQKENETAANSSNNMENGLSSAEKDLANVNLETYAENLRKNSLLFDKMMNKTLNIMNQSISMETGKSFLKDNSLQEEGTQNNSLSIDAHGNSSRLGSTEAPQDRKVHMFMVSWRKLMPAPARKENVFLRINKTEAAMKPEEVSMLKGKMGAEKASAGKGTERDGLFVRPGLNRGVIETVLTNKNVNATKQSNVNGLLSGDVSRNETHSSLRDRIANGRNHLKKKVKKTRISGAKSGTVSGNATGVSPESLVFAGQALDITQKPLGDPVREPNPDELERGLWTEEAINYTAKADQDFKKQQQYIDSHGGPDALKELIKERNKANKQNAMRDPQRADATKEQLKDFYERNDEITSQKSAQNAGLGNKSSTTPESIGSDKKGKSSNLQMATSAGSNSGSETESNTWTEVGTNADSMAESQANDEIEVEEDPDMIEKEAGWNWDNDDDDNDESSYNRPQGLGLWSDSGTGTGVGVSIGANAGAEAGSDTASETEIGSESGPTSKWPGFGSNDGFGMGMGMSAGSQSGAETMTETSVGVNTDASSSTQSKTGSQSNSKPGGSKSKSKYKWKMGPSSTTGLVPSGNALTSYKANQVGTERPADILGSNSNSKIRPNLRLPYQRIPGQSNVPNSISLKELSRFKAGPQLGVQTNTKVNTNIHAYSSSQSQPPTKSKSKLKPPLRTQSHVNMERTKQLLAERTKNHQQRLEASTLNNPLRVMKMTEKTPMQLKLEEIGHKTRNKPRGSKQGNQQTNENPNAQISSGNIDPKKTEASVDIYYEGKNTKGVDINAGISINDGTNVVKPKANSKFNRKHKNSPYHWYESYPYYIPSTAEINKKLNSIPYALYLPQMRRLSIKTAKSRL